MRIVRLMAAHMKKLARAKPWIVIRHEFANGLRVSVRWIPTEEGGDWYLGIWRIGIRPRESEVQSCQRGVALRVDAARAERMRLSRWQGVFYMWWEAEDDDAYRKETESHQ